MPVLLFAMFQECHQSLVNIASRKEERGCSRTVETKAWVVWEQLLQAALRRAGLCILFCFDSCLAGFWRQC